MRVNSPPLFKRFILIGMAWAWCGLSLGQINLIHEDFDAFPTSSPALPNQGWVNNVLAGDSSFDQWNFGNPGARNFSSPISGRFAIFDSDEYSGGGGAENIALESPAFSAQNYSSIRLKFDQYYDGIYNSTDSILVEVYNGSKWLAVYSYTGSSSISNSQDLNITSNLAGTSNAKVRFRFVGDWSYYWIIDNVLVEAYYNYDATVEQVSFSSSSCGDANDSITVSLSNIGLQSISNFTVRARVSGSLNGSPINTIVSANYAASLASGAKSSIKLPSFNTAAGGSVILSAWTQVSNDQNRLNDTLKKPMITFMGTPNAPGATGVSRCGEGTVDLQAYGVSSSDSVVWYDSANALAPVGSGLIYTTPVLGAGNYTYYVAAGRGVLDHNLQTTFLSNNGQSGVMFDVTAKRALVVDSFEVSIDSGRHLVEVYYKTGSYAGYETNSGAWTLLGSTTVTSTQASGGPGVFVNVGKSLALPSGVKHSFYIQLPNSTAINYTNGTGNFSNAEFTIQTGVGKGSNFGATFSPRSFNGGVYYSYFPLCESSRTAVQVSVKPLPAGAELNQGNPFLGAYNSGKLNDPHTVAEGDSISFELVPPSFTTNTAYGIDWSVSSLIIKTLNGTPIPSSDTATIAPSSTQNARLLFVPSISVADSTFHVKIKINSLITGCDTFIETYFYVAPRPNASFSYSSVCNGSSMTFVNQSSLISGTLSFDWDFAGLGTSKLENPNFVFPAAGSYSVILKASSDYGYVDYDTQTIVVNAVPQTSFNAVNACEGTAIQLTNMTNMPTGNAKFTWDFGDGTKDSTQNASHEYGAPGTYLVSYTISVNGCTATAKKSVTQAPRPLVEFSSVSSCDNEEVVFTNLSKLAYGSMGYQWDFGDGKSAASTNPKHDYAKFGIYDVTLHASTDLGCIDSFTAKIALLEAPRIDVSYSAPCVGQSIAFANNTISPSGFNNTYFWSFGDGATSSDYSPSHTYPGIGAYSAYIRSMSTNGCSDSLHMTIIINEKPKAGFVVPTLVCNGDSVNFLNSTVSSKITQVSYQWDFGNGQSSTRKDTSFTYTKSGSYDVVLVATITGGCSDTARKTIKVVPLPLSTFKYSSMNTQNGAIRFEADEVGAGTAYTWFFDDGFKSYLKDPVHVFEIDRTYSVELNTVNIHGCKSTHIEPVRIYRTGITGMEFGAEMFVYPNPNNGHFTLELGGEVLENYTLRMANGLGQEIPFSYDGSLGGSVAIDLLNNSKGVYYIILQTKSGQRLRIPVVLN